MKPKKQSLTLRCAFPLTKYIQLDLFPDSKLILEFAHFLKPTVEVTNKISPHLILLDFLQGVKNVELYLHVFSGNLVEALSQLSHQILISTHQQTANLFGDPSIVEETLRSGGRERRRQGQLVQYYGMMGREVSMGENVVTKTNMKLFQVQISR